MRMHFHTYVFYPDSSVFFVISQLCAEHVNLTLYHHLQKPERQNMFYLIKTIVFLWPIPRYFMLSKPRKKYYVS